MGGGKYENTRPYWMKNGRSITNYRTKRYHDPSPTGRQKHSKSKSKTGSILKIANGGGGELNLKKKTRRSGKEKKGWGPNWGPN